LNPIRAMKRLALSALSAGVVLVLAQPALADTLKKPELDKLVTAQRAAPSSTFREFLQQAAKADPKLESSVSAYEKTSPLLGDDITNISRLLGLYNRMHNQKAVISAIEAMVAIPTVRDDKVPPYESKPIIEFGRLIEEMAKNFGLQYRNVDNRIFDVKLPG